MGLLENKVILITGASRGIGKAIAEECVLQGGTVVFTYLSSDEKARDLENELSNDALFLKIHKSFIINVNYVQSLDRILNHVILSDGNRLPISRNNIKLVFNYFNN